MPDNSLPTAQEVQSWPGLRVKDPSGTVLGTVRSVYGDDDTGLPEWVEVALPDDGQAYVPVLGARAGDQELRVTQTAERVASAPRFAPDAKLEVDDERALYAHYGIPTSQEVSDTLLPAAADLPGDAAPEPVPAAVTPAPTASTQEPLSRPARVEPAPTPAAVPPPAPLLQPATSSYDDADGSGRGRQAALLLAVPAVLLLAKRLRSGGLRPTRQRDRRAAPAALLVPAAAAGVATVLQRRTRRQQKQPVEVAPLTGPVVVGAASVPADRT